MSEPAKQRILVNEYWVDAADQQGVVVQIVPPIAEHPEGFVEIRMVASRRMIRFDTSTFLRGFRRLTKYADDPPVVPEIKAGSLVRLRSSLRPIMTVCRVYDYVEEIREPATAYVEVGYVPSYGMSGKLEKDCFPLACLVAVPETEVVAEPGDMTQ